MAEAECPSRETLEAYLAGRLADQAAGAVSDHLSTCQRCQETVSMIIEADDPLLAQLGQPAEADPFAEEPQCGRAVARAFALVGEPGGPDEPPPTESFLLGTLGEYELLAKLGQGGMGTVYKARQTKLDKLVALKVLPEHKMQDARAVARFEREMRAVGRLRHPNIVEAYDARDVEGTYFLAMEYVEGLDLSELVRRRGPLPVADACEIIRQAAVGLEYAHQNGMVHRDIKPSNLMLAGEGRGTRDEGRDFLPSPSGRGAGGEGLDAGRGKTGQGRGTREAGILVPRPSAPAPLVKILDLGLALIDTPEQPGEEMTGTGQAMGTADYMAPEQATDSHTVDIRADVYSLGCTLYKLLTGRAPFGDPEHQSNLQKLMAHMQEPVPPVRELRPDVPDDLAALLDRMLAKSPDARPATPGDVAEAISSLSLWERVGVRADLAKLLDPADAKSATSTLPAPGSTAPFPSSALVGTQPHIQRPLSLRERVRVRALKAPLALWEMVRLRAFKAPLALWQRASVRASRHRSPLKTAIGTMFLGFGLVAAAAIIITIRHPDGRKTVVEVPEESKVGIKDGHVDVTLPPRGKVPPLAVAPFDAAEAKKHQQAWAVHLGKPVEQTNAVGMKLVLIPAGEFEMGSTPEEIAQAIERAKRFNHEGAVSRFLSEGPRHRVRITKPFYLGAHEVTVGQFRKFVEESSYRTDAEEDGKGGSGLNSATGKWEQKPEYTWRNPWFTQTDDQPVVNVSWNDAVAFCEWLSRKEKTYRLPTEAQWEYACRAGSSTRHRFGGDDGSLGEYTWYYVNSDGKTHAVGEKKPNAWGLYDMHGNVREWCADWHAADYYAGSPSIDPTGPTSGLFRVDRGGSWNYVLMGCRSAVRRGCLPDFRSRNLGFRVACEIPQAKLEVGSRKLEVGTEKAEGKAEGGKPKAEEAEQQMQALPPIKIGPPVKIKPVEIEIKPEPIEIKSGEPMSGWALVSRPAAIDGLKSWTIETAAHRSLYVKSVTCSSDGKWIASADNDGTVRLFDAQSRQLVRALLGHTGAVGKLSWALAGPYLASTGDAQTIRLWKRRVRTIVAHDPFGGRRHARRGPVT